MHIYVPLFTTAQTLTVSRKTLNNLYVKKLPDRKTDIMNIRAALSLITYSCFQVEKFEHQFLYQNMKNMQTIIFVVIST